MYELEYPLNYILVCVYILALIPGALRFTDHKRIERVDWLFFMLVGCSYNLFVWKYNGTVPHPVYLFIYLISFAVFLLMLKIFPFPDDKSVGSKGAIVACCGWFNPFFAAIILLASYKCVWVLRHNERYRNTSILPHAAFFGLAIASFSIPEVNDFAHWAASYIHRPFRS